MTSPSLRAAGIGGVITAQVNIDLTSVVDTEARYLLAHLDAVPAGATLMIDVGNMPPGYHAINHLRDQIHRLHVVFVGTDRPDRLAAWVNALRNDRGW